MSDIKETFMKLTRGVTKTSGELLKSTKLSLSLNSEEEKLKQVYMEIGKKVHEIYQYGGTLGQFFNEKYVEIQRVETAIQDIKEQLNAIKGVRECPKCKAGVERSAGFCPKCGATMDKAPAQGFSREGQSIAPDGQNMPSDGCGLTEPVKNVIICRSCQAENDPGSRFCLTCGRML